MFERPPTAQASEQSGDGREWRLIERLLTSAQDEQRRARRWGVFFKVATLSYFFALLYLFFLLKFDGMEQYDGPHTALVDIRGEIASKLHANADWINASLQAAFEDEDTQAVILRIDSPGGSPVQAGYVYDEILRLRALYPDTKVYAAIEDLGASAAYYIASAADEIYADKASLVGSIGVVGGGFGFVDALKKLGVERRSYTSGEHKAFLDPFQPEKQEEKRFWEGVLQTAHQQFIDRVKQGRGDRLKAEDKVFSGLIWLGETALDMGLIDGLGGADYIAREVVGEENVVDFSYQEDAFKTMIDRLGTSVGNTLGRMLGLDKPLGIR